MATKKREKDTSNPPPATKGVGLKNPTPFLYEFKRTRQGEVPINCKLTKDGLKCQQSSTRLYKSELWDEDMQ